VISDYICDKTLLQICESGAPTANMSETTMRPSKFRRQRAARACETCNKRKVRCDAASLGIPCTNCVAFDCECIIPQQRRKRRDAHQDESRLSPSRVVLDERNQSDSTDLKDSPAPDFVKPSQFVEERSGRSNSISSLSTRRIMRSAMPTERMKNDMFVGFLQDNPKEDHIKEPGKVIYLSEDLV